MGLLSLLLIAGFLLDGNGPWTGCHGCWHPAESAGIAVSVDETSTVDFDGGSACDQEDATLSIPTGIRFGLGDRWSVVRFEESAVSRERSEIFHPPPA